ncbi:MAG: 3-hydroxyacyl-CoA dehydrogenase [Dehalococcoidia bacterium]|nr:3-hydroxyacyl-CoA dehydrogenase [Dehalococcoidia bacterium]
MEIAGIGVVVTGGGSGLGEATARAFAARGAKVAIIDLKGEDVAQAIGNGARFSQADVTNEEQVTAALDGAVAAFGGIQVVVNCAGIAPPSKTVDRDGKPHDLALFRKVVEVNLIGTFNVIRLAGARMLKNQPNADGERGVIINTASIAAFEGQIGQAAYGASKGGVVGLTLPVARDFARDGIRCVTIAPGLFMTPMLAGLPEAAQQALGGTVPFPSRLGQPEEYAKLALHIVENAMLNGETIRLDGAIRLPPR